MGLPDVKIGVLLDLSSRLQQQRGVQGVRERALPLSWSESMLIIRWESSRARKWPAVHSIRPQVLTDKA